MNDDLLYCISCCLCVEEQLFHVAGKQYGKEVLIVALSVNRSVYIIYII